MPVIEFLKDRGKYKAGERVDIPQDVVDLLPKDTYRIFPVQPGDEPNPSGEPVDEQTDEHVKGTKEVSFPDVHTDAGKYGLIVDETDVEVTVISDKLQELTMAADDGNEFVRIQIPILYQGQKTFVRVPPSVAEEMWKKIVLNSARPVDKKKPRFMLSKKGTGIKTKWNVSFVGMGDKIV
jgi:hypothetical protein